MVVENGESQRVLHSIMESEHDRFDTCFRMAGWSVDVSYGHLFQGLLLCEIFTNRTKIKIVGKLTNESFVSGGWGESGTGIRDRSAQSRKVVHQTYNDYASGKLLLSRI